MIAAAFVLTGLLVLWGQMAIQRYKALLRRTSEEIGTTQKVFPHQHPCRYRPHPKYRTIFPA